MLKKRLLVLFLTIILSLTAHTAITYAAEQSPEVYFGQCGDNVYWELYFENGGLTLALNGEGEMWNYFDLHSVSYYENGEMPSWFSSRYDISKVIIGEGVSRIGSGAFYYCRNLQSVELPDSLQTIGDFAFVGCSSLETIILPNNIYELGPRSFAACSSLQQVVLPSELLNIGEFAFCTCVNLVDISLPEGIL